MGFDGEAIVKTQLVVGDSILDIPYFSTSFEAAF